MIFYYFISDVDGLFLQTSGVCVLLLAVVMVAKEFLSQEKKSKGGA